MKKIYFFLVMLFVATSSWSQISITATGSDIQNFNGLAGTGTNVTWTNNTTVPGWYSNRTTYNAGTGTGTAGSLYSFGTAAGDRALGSVNSNATSDIAYGAILVNNSTQTITNMTVAFTGEQWRRESPTSTDKLTFYYIVSATPVTTVDATTAGWTTVGALDFNAPQTGTAAQLDGNAAANRTVVPATGLTGLSVPAGSYVVIKWIDPNASGNDLGLAVDDVTIAWTVPAAPPAPTVTSFTPSSGYTGTSVTITGTNFTGATAVTFGGTNAASYTVDDPTQITAVVGAGASGVVAVTTPGGTGSSAGSFTYNGYISNGAGAWNTGATWLGGGVPPTGATVTLAHNVTLDVPASINSLTLNNAVLTLGSNNLTITDVSPSSVSGASATAYINTNGTGALVRTVGGAGTFGFPVGTATKWQDASVNFSNVTGPTEVAARFISGNPGSTGLPLTESGDNIDAVSAIGYWEITTTPAVTDPYDVSFTARDFSDVIDYTKLHLLKRADGSSAWTLNGTHVPTTGSNALATLSRTGLTGFSQFGVGGESNSALPVKFVDVKAYGQGNGVRVEWANQTEAGVANYKVERSTDGVNYTALSTVAPSLNNGTKASYNYFDASPVNGVNYYRIQSLEADGRKLYSLVVRVDTRGNDRADLVVYPNPVTGNQLSFQAKGLERGQYTLRVFNAGGQQVHTEVVVNNGTGITQVVQLPSTIKTGVYTIQLSSGEVKMTKSFVVR